jgi:zinc protease
MAPPQRRSLSRLAEHAAAIIIASGLAVALFGWSASLRNLRPSSDALDDPNAALPGDPRVIVDSLENGLRYYVRENIAPRRTAELRLVVNAGSVLEDDDQRGLAHAVEHMAFRGTTHFPGEQLVDYLQNLGMRQGQDVNAYTDFDETVFRLTIPTDDKRALEQGITILADWAAGVRFDSAEAARERGVVFEEWRAERGAGRRLYEARTAMLLGGSRYANRLPIGDTAVLSRFDVGAMRRFYRDWYRPDLMSVVAVGDFAPARVRALIREHFGSIPRRTTERGRPTYSTVATERAAPPRVAVLTDTEATRARVALWRLAPDEPVRTATEMRAQIARELFDAMLDARLAEAARRRDSPLRSAGTSRPELARGAGAFVVSSEVPRDAILSGLDALMSEVERVRRDGFSTTELERHRRILLRDAEQSLSVNVTPNSSNLAELYASHFLEGEPMLARATTRGLYVRLVPAIRLEEVNRLAREMGADSGRVVVITTPRAGAIVPDSGKVLATIADVERRPTVPHSDTAAVVPLLPRRPDPGKITGERDLVSLDMLEWTLSNGMRVLLKPTRYRANQILVTAWSAGGASLATDGDYVSAYMSDRVVSAMGVGAFDESQLERALSGTSMHLGPVVTDHDVALRGESNLTDLASLFQLLHLYFTAPRADTTAFAALRDRLKRGAVARVADPDAVFRDTIAVTLGKHALRERPPTAGLYQELDLRRALDFWRQRTANASNFTVLIVGSFEPSDVRELVSQYLASLPAGRRERPRDTGNRYADGVIERVVHSGIDPRGDTRIIFTGDVDREPDDMLRLHLLRELLASSLEGRLRDSLGGTYSVDVDLRVEHPPWWEYALGIEFAAAPTRLDTLARATFAEIERFRRSGPTPQELARIKAAEVREINAGLEDNEYWMDELESHVRMEWPLDHIMQERRALDAVDASTMRLTAMKFLRLDNYLRVSRVPAR